MNRIMMTVFLASLLGISLGAAGAEVVLTSEGLSSTARLDAGAPEGGGHNCCVDHNGAGCTDPGIEACVCAVDSTCCEFVWDTVCVDVAVANDCDTCDDCLTPHLTTGCNDPLVESCVCSQDPFCCNTSWDTTCVGEVVDFDCLSEIPVNDNCIDALQVVADGTYLFRSAGATTDGPALPAPDCDEGNGVAFESDVWYCYTPECSNDITVSLCGPSDFDSRLAIYEGCACPVTDDRRVFGGCSDNSGKCAVNDRPEITFEAESGLSYLIRIGGGADPAEGDGTMRITGGSAESRLDCNGNGDFDGCDILTNFSTDCNGNRYPDECETNIGEVLMHQLPSQINGEFSDADCAICDAGQQARAERFLLDEPKQIVAIGLWGGYFDSDSAPVDDFTVIFHTEVDGVPDAVLATPGFASARFETGVQLFNVREWLFVLTLDTPMDFDAGSYFVEIFNNTAGNPDSFFWETGDLDGDHGAPGGAFDSSTPGVNWVAQGDKNLAMILFGQPAADCDDDNRPDACQTTVACCMPDETCTDLISACCVSAGGEAQDPGSDCATFGCDFPQIVHAQGLVDQTRPHSGYIDPRQESVDGVNVSLGLQEALVRFDRDVFACDQSDVGIANFVLTETGGAAPPTIDVVAYVDSDKSYVRVHWDRPITVQQWTTLRADVCGVSGTPIINLGDLGPGTNEPDRVDFGYLPADVDQGSEVDPFDLLRFRQYVTDVIDPVLGMESDYININRNGVVGTSDPFDLLTFRQMTNGVSPSTRAWLGQTIDAQP